MTTTKKKVSSELQRKNRVRFQKELPEVQALPLGKTIYNVVLKGFSVGMTFSKDEAKSWLGASAAHAQNRIEPRQYRGA